MSVSVIEPVCGNCRHHVVTSAYGCKGGSRKACRYEHREWVTRKGCFQTRDYKGYGPRHHCHRMGDFIPKEESDER